MSILRNAKFSHQRSKAPVPPGTPPVGAPTMRPVVMGTNLQLKPVASSMPVSGAFGQRFNDGRPKGIHVNSDSVVGMIQNNPAETFKLLGRDLTVPHMTTGQVSNFYGALNPIKDIADGVRYKGVAGEGVLINSVADFADLMENPGFAKNGIFVPNTLGDRQFAACPELGNEGVVALDGGDIPPEVMEVIMKAYKRLHADYTIFTISMMAATGCAISDVRTELVLPALDMVDRLIASKVGKIPSIRK